MRRFHHRFFSALALVDLSSVRSVNKETAACSPESYRMSVHLRRRRFGAALFIATAFATAGCGGGGSIDSTPVPTSSSSTSTTCTSTVTQTLPTAAGSVAFPAVCGVSAGFTFAAGATSGTTFTAVSSTTAPAGAPSPTAVRRAEALSGAVPFLYVTLTVSQTTPTSVFAGETAALSSAQPANAQYTVEIDDVTKSPATELTAIPGIAAVGSATFNNQNGLAYPNGPAPLTTLVPGSTYLFQYYYVPAGTVQTGSISVPITSGQVPVTTIQPAGNVSAAVQLGGFTTNTTVTFFSSNALIGGMPSPATTGTVFFVIGLNASSTVNGDNLTCGSACQNVTPVALGLPPDVLARTAGKSFFAVECSATACPVLLSDVVKIVPAGNQLVVGPVTPVGEFALTTTPKYVVFYYE